MIETKTPRLYKVRVQGHAWRQQVVTKEKKKTWRYRKDIWGGIYDLFYKMEDKIVFWKYQGEETDGGM